MRDLILGNNSDISRLSKKDREKRVLELIEESNYLLDYAIENHVIKDNRKLVGTVILFSGGNDSTVLAHLMKSRATHAVHANTGIGIEETRQYVRDTCNKWNLPLMEIMSPRESDRYENLVLEWGFPGAAHHYKMYQRLKERPLRVARKQLIKNQLRERVIFLSGRRRDESNRRAEIPEMEKEGSIVWVAPLVSWTKMDMNTYRLMQGDVPVNRVSDLIHMSGECLCGSFSKRGELEEVGEWFPDVVEYIRNLESRIANREDIPEHRRFWGWSSDYQSSKKDRKSGKLCSSCAARHET